MKISVRATVILSCFDLNYLLAVSALIIYKWEISADGAYDVNSINQIFVSDNLDDVKRLFRLG
jgi:hypothetical protein